MCYGHRGKGFARGKEVYVGIDVHKKDWTVHVVCGGETLAHCTIASESEPLIGMLQRFEAREVHTVYEAGPTGFWLHEALIRAGFDSRVTPPSLVPRVGDRVKTDHRDSTKLATLLASGFLKSVHVLSPEERAHRQLLRTRNQLERHRREAGADQIDALVSREETPSGMLEHRQARVRSLETMAWEHEALAVSMKALVALFRYLEQNSKRLDEELEALLQTDNYRDRVGLMADPGMGLYTAMTIFMELQDVARFQRADQLSSYLGLTPSERSSGERIRVGGITRCGNATLRSRFVESSWT